MLSVSGTTDCQNLLTETWFQWRRGDGRMKTSDDEMANIVVVQ